MRGGESVLTISTGYDPGYLTHAVATGRENYYLSAVAEHGEPPGIWTGAGCPELGLPAGSEVDPKVMERLYGAFVDPRILVPLGVTTAQTAREQLWLDRASAVARAWATEHRYALQDVKFDTFIKVISDYGAGVAAGGGRVYLSGLEADVIEQLRKGGLLGDHVRATEATAILGESTRAAYLDAESWLLKSGPGE